MTLILFQLRSDYNWSKIAKALKKANIICAGKNVIKLNYPVENSFFQIDFYRATEQTFGIQELIRTGSAGHNMWLAGYALSKGFRLKYSEGLIKDEIAVAGETEESVFSSFRLAMSKVPAQRSNRWGPAWQKLEQDQINECCNKKICGALT